MLTGKKWKWRFQILNFSAGDNNAQITYMVTRLPGVQLGSERCRKGPVTIEAMIRLSP